MTRLALMVIVLASACRGAAHDAANGPVIDTLPGGIVRVTNTAPTAWQDTAHWRFVEERVIQPAEGSPGEFSDVTKLVADDDGNLFVMQIMPTVIKAFDSTGAWVRDIGRQGNGPGEFPDGMLAIRGDTLVIQDPNNQRLTLYRTDGTLLGTHPSQCCNFSSSLPLLDDGRVMVMGPPPPTATGARVAYYLTRLDGTVTDTLVRPAGPPRDRAATMWSASQKMGAQVSTMDIGIPGMPVDLATWRGDGMLVSGNTGRYQIALRRGFADTARIIVAEAPQLMRTDAERDSLLERAVSSQGPRWRDALRQVASVGQVPRERPLWSALATDREGRIWVGRPDADAEVAILDVFSPDGTLLGRVRAPHPRILDGYWTRERVHVRDADAEGRSVIRVYRLVRAPA